MAAQVLSANILGMGDPYRKEDRKPQRKESNLPQWKDLTPDQRKAWCRYFQGRGPRPIPTKNVMKWDEE